MRKTGKLFPTDVLQHFVTTCNRNGQKNITWKSPMQREQIKECSCTAGDITSIAMYAQVLKGRKVRIPTFIQYGSERVREEAKRRGIHETLLTAGVQMIEEPGCGACINAGPGGPQKGQVAISATNRNMPGRMGEGDAYLANPYVVAASAIKGVICGPEDL